jgi:hypothetical protein
MRLTGNGSWRLFSSALLATGGLILGVANACTGDGSSELSGGDGSGGGSTFSGQGGNIGQVGAGGSGFGGGCASEVYSGEGAPLDMYIMLDKSGSMDGGKWSDVTSAIDSFMANPQSAGLGVGIQFFPGGPSCPEFCPQGNCPAGCGNCLQFPVIGGVCEGSPTSCDVMEYATPAVAIAELPGVASDIQTAMANNSPSGGTPTAPALTGAIDYARTHAMANPGHEVIVVLATDGNPQGCSPEDIPSIRAIAEGGVSGTPSILTFVIGVGDLEANLDQIAQGGGSMDAFMVDAGGNVEQQFLDALEAIKGQALGCAYTIPLPEGGEADYDHVNVVYTPDGGSGQTIPYVGSPDQCPPGGDGWYYDNAQDPTQILLCPGTCDRVEGDTTGEVEVVLGCATVPL